MTGRVWVPGADTVAHRALARVAAAGGTLSSDQLVPNQPARVRCSVLHRLLGAGHLTRASRDRYEITPTGRTVLQCAGLTPRAAQVLLTLTAEPQRPVALLIRMGRDHDPISSGQLHAHLSDLTDRDLVEAGAAAYHLTPAGLALQDAARLRLTLPHTIRATDSAHQHHAELVSRAERSAPTRPASQPRPPPLKRRVLTALAARPLTTADLLAALAQDGHPPTTRASLVTTLSQIKHDELVTARRNPDNRRQYLWSVA